MGQYDEEALLTETRNGRMAIAGLIVLVLLVVFVGPHARNHWRYRHYRVESAKFVQSRYDGRQYRVHLRHKGADQAADRLAFLHEKSIKLMAALRRKYAVAGSMGDKFPQRRAIAANILNRYDPDQLSESSPKNPEGDTSYTLDKGALLALCLREKDPSRTGDPDTHDLHDSLTLLFVIVHELAHLGVDSTDHPPEFWQCFKFLLSECSQADIVPGGRWPNYQRDPVRYCGLTVDYNPYFDSLVPMPQ